MRKAVVLALGLVLLTGCTGEAGSPAAPAKPATTTVQQSPTVKMTALDLAQYAGYEAEVYDTDEMFVETAAEVGPVRVYTFANAEARDQYLAVAQSFGGTYQSGESHGAFWVVAGDANSEDVATLAADLLK